MWTTITVIIISWKILIVALEEISSCSPFDNCSCKTDHNNFDLNCSDAIQVSINKTTNEMYIMCFAETLNATKFSDLPFNGTRVTLKCCAEKIYFNDLMSVLNTDNVIVIQLRGNITNGVENLHQVSDLSDSLLPIQSLKRLEMYLYTVDENLFVNTTELPELLISFSQALLTNDFLNTLPKLRKIDLSISFIRDIPKYIFVPAVYQLEEIDLSANLITDVNDQSFRFLNNLKRLNLEMNSLKTIENVFYSLINLEEIDLSQNEIHFIHRHAFRNNAKLKFIDLSSNDLTLFEYRGRFAMSPFNYADDLQILDLRKNQLCCFLSEWFRPVVSILDIRNNNITTIDLDRLPNTFAQNVKFNLGDVNITAVRNNKTMFNKYRKNIFIKENSVVKDTRFTNLIQYYNEIQSNHTITDILNLKSLNCSEVATNQPYSCVFVGRKYYGLCPAECDCFVKPWELIYVVNCTNRTQDLVPKLNAPNFLKVEMHLENNSLIFGPTANMGYDNVTQLYLSNNIINDIRWIPSKLEIYDIDNNNISYLNQEIVVQLNRSEYLRNISMHNNPWKCDCGSVKVVSLLKKLVILKKVNATNVTCGDGRTKLIDLVEAELCKTHTTLILVLIICSVVLGMLSAILTTLYMIYQDEIKIWLFAHKLFLRFITIKESNENKIYDAFVCYSHRDEDFLASNLVPLLEHGEKPYRLCIHVRDWVVGELITTQMLKSIEDSRRTIIVLSPNFLESNWGLMEFRMAHTKAMQENRARVIVILYQDVDEALVKDENLKKYLRTKSYISWNDPKFLAKLRYALPFVSNINMNVNYRDVKETQ